MFSDTYAVLEKFDNAHEFERMCAAILIAQGYREVVPMAPRGGSDEGQDIIFTMRDGSKGLACCTLRKDKDIDAKFREDFSQRKPGEYKQYILFCTAYLTFEQKKKFSAYCLNKLNAIFIPQDIEALTGLLDNAHQDIRERFLHIPDQSRLRQQETLTIVSNQIKASESFNEAKQAMANYDWVSADALMQMALQYFPIPEAPCYCGIQMSAALTEEFKRNHDVPPGYRQNALFYDIHIHLQFFAPPIERAMYWLDRARQQNEGEGEKVAAATVLRELALLHGLMKNYDEMLTCVKEAISISPDISRTSFKEPEHLAILAHGCINEPDQAGALQELGKLLKLRLPVSPRIFQQSIIDSKGLICWIVMGKEDAWIGKPKPDFPMQLWIKTGYDGGTADRIATYPNPHEPGKNTLIPPDGIGIPLDLLTNQLGDQFLFICPLPANPQYAP